MSTSEGGQEPKAEGPQHSREGAPGLKKRRTRLACKGSFKGASKLVKEYGQPMPGIMDFPPSVKLSSWNLMVGSLYDNKNVRLWKQVGKLSAHMGFVQPGTGGARFLHPEEAVFLIEAGQLVVHLNSGEVEEPSSGPHISSVQEAYCSILSESVSLLHYIVYAHLARSGLKVLIRSAVASNPSRVYDVHEASRQLAVTRPPPPKFCVVDFISASQPFPCLSELSALVESTKQRLGIELANSVAMKVAIVAPDGDVSFYSLNCPL